MKRIGNPACSITLSILLTAGTALAGVTTPNPAPPPPEFKINGVTTPNPEPPPPSGLTFETNGTAYQPFVSFDLIELIVTALSNMGSNRL
ncbi:MAG TPA: hypothetical protein VNI02_21320 [Blastocatellia bacterium]|jgi:hypothetical protein|nr:hypothetical protein [Blastocatellia bacterium]